MHGGEPPICPCDVISRNHALAFLRTPDSPCGVFFGGFVFFRNLDPEMHLLNSSIFSRSIHTVLSTLPLRLKYLEHIELRIYICLRPGRGGCGTTLR